MNFKKNTKTEGAAFAKKVRKATKKKHTWKNLN